MAYKIGRCLLLDLLRKKDMSQLQLAEIMGIRVQQINKYVLNKQRMSLQVAKNIATILNCKIDDLYEWIEVGNEE
ncbi:XRE family transcriptional regulator [Neobacillus notoginsengisoli]|uniref:XRE family transcriptional regulator n=1 Tax=Neobacillus notoginsengisoli TaxID=1578198 RepID=A0A417YRL9_9BACI|nr:helix-turn-helix transcriptional regulator [Neobacillus notoginsengisoli]RHW37288.1 XRE family transcriptional regulator [Neobacillus notoginsengisoli]